MLIHICRYRHIPTQLYVTYTCTYTHIHIHTHTQIYIHIHTHTHKHTQTHTRTHTHTHTHTYTNTQTLTCTHVCIQAYMHRQTYTLRSITRTGSHKCLHTRPQSMKILLQKRTEKCNAQLNIQDTPSLAHTYELVLCLAHTHNTHTHKHTHTHTTH